MKNTNQENTKKLPQKAFARRRGFTMLELLVVVVIVGAIAAIAIPSLIKSRDLSYDAVKLQNASKLNIAAKALFEAGHDASSYTDAAAFIAAVKNGITIPSQMTGSTVSSTVQIDQTINPAAYTYTAATANAPARFTAKTGDRNVTP